MSRLQPGQPLRIAAASLSSKRSVNDVNGDNGHVQAPASSHPPGASAKATTAQEKEANPWRHFQAFGNMDEYVDVTLIHYDNADKDNNNSTP